MNKDRRNALSEIEKRLSGFVSKEFLAAVELIKATADELSEIRSDLETLRDEEQEYRDNMPESLQSGEKAEASDSAICEMDEALSSIDEAQATLEEINADGLTEQIDQAQGFVQNAASY